jgi:hypothetical protein
VNFTEVESFDFPKNKSHYRLRRRNSKKNNSSDKNHKQRSKNSTQNQVFDFDFLILGFGVLIVESKKKRFQKVELKTNDFRKNRSRKTDSVFLSRKVRLRLPISNNKKKEKKNFNQKKNIETLFFFLPAGEGKFKIPLLNRYSFEIFSKKS